MTIAEQITGANGTYFLKTNTAYTGMDFLYLIVNAKAIFSVLKDSEDVSQLPADKLNLASAEVEAGMIIMAKDKKHISKVTLSQGTAIGIIA
jgi:hypothetical protein